MLIIEFAKEVSYATLDYILLFCT